MMVNLAAISAGQWKGADLEPFPVVTSLPVVDDYEWFLETA
jgi:hypothetical protein